MTREILSEQFGRLSTAVKMLAILSLALLPLGLIALLASLQATRNADDERRADLRIALVESTRKLGVEMVSDISAMRVAANAVALGATPEETCERLTAIFAAHNKPSTPFALFGAASAPICATPGFASPRPSTIALDIGPRTVFQRDAVDVIVPAQNGGAIVIARYPAATLTRFARPAHFAGDVAMTLSDTTATLPLMTPSRSFLSQVETASAPVGLMELTLTMSASRVPFGAIGALLAFLPLLMWASAAAITFLLVDRLLIRPLRELRAAVASQAAGQPFVFSGARTPAREIRELGETFAQSGRAIAAHQADLASALADQTKATREVHHRVKNNLQVVASLINLHARAAQSPDATAAYAAIQRRVDALSIVHRNHYAELDADSGIDLRRLLGEIATNLRANVDSEGGAPPISLSASTVSVSQDTAIALAFLVTELIELAMNSDAAAPITIGVTQGNDENRASIAIASSALRGGPALEERLASRYTRIIEGLARQLRSPLTRDKRKGRFAVEFTTVPPIPDA